jgi:putative ABC transport system permease protein
MWRRLRALFRGERLDRELNAEMRFHLDMEAQKYERQGFAPEAARVEAVRNFGPLARHQAETRDARGVGWLDDFVQDVRFAGRTLAKSPGFTTVAVVTLGLGIGANAAIFSAINGVLFSALPYAHGHRLVLVEQSAPLANRPNIGVSIRELYDYRAQLRTVSDLVEFHQMNFDLLRRGEPDRVATGVVSYNFFDVLGIQPMLGRTFADGDDDQGAAPVIVLGYDYWQTKFGGDPGILGQTFEMNDRPHTVVGVLPDVPHYPNPVDLYMPTSACPFRSAAERTIERNRRAFSGLQVFGRMAPGATLTSVQADVAATAERLRGEHAAVYRTFSGFRASTRPVLTALTANARPMLWLLMGATGLVLLLACANVASLTMARLLGRHRELAMRSALGARRGRLVRQLLAESTLLSCIAAVAGLAFAWSTLGVLTRFVGRFTERTDAIALDPGVLAFTLVVAVVSGLAFGTFPALATRVNVLASLKQGSPGAGLLLASVLRLQRIDAGYRGDRVLTANIAGNFSTYPNATAQLRLYEPLVERLNATAGVEVAAVTNAVPLVPNNPGQTPFDIEGRTTDPDQRPTGDVNIASPRYFEVLDIPVLAGRAFADLDHREAPRVVLVNQAMVRHWQGREVVGSRVSFDSGATWMTVVGVVGDVRQYGLERPVIPQIYVPLAQMTGGLGAQVLVRGPGDPSALARVVREAVHALDPDMPVEDVQTMEDLRRTTLATPRLTAVLLWLFAGLALVVTLAGITGVIATSVSERTREFGLRMALGAPRTSVLAMVLKQGLGLVVAGLLLGLAGALAFGNALSAYLFETAPRDPVVLAAVALAFVCAGALACLGPARRATSIDPLVALRSE